MLETTGHAFSKSFLPNDVAVMLMTTLKTPLMPKSRKPAPITAHMALPPNSNNIIGHNAIMKAIEMQVFFVPYRRSITPTSIWAKKPRGQAADSMVMPNNKEWPKP